MAILFAAFPGTLPALTQEELDTSRNLWNANGSDDYDYFMQRSCFCAPEFIQPGIVKVRSGMVSAVSDAETLQPLDPQLFLTVDDLFDDLQEALDLPAFMVQAQFDSMLGYPTSISIDQVADIADDEISYTARSLSLVPEPSSLWLALLGAMAIAWRTRSDCLPIRTRRCSIRSWTWTAPKSLSSSMAACWTRGRKRCQERMALLFAA